MYYRLSGESIPDADASPALWVPMPVLSLLYVARSKSTSEYMGRAEVELYTWDTSALLETLLWLLPASPQDKTHPEPVKISLGCNEPTASRARTPLLLAPGDSRRAGQE